jgi:hypothetical protein
MRMIMLRMRWAGMWHTWGRRGMYMGFWWESQKKETFRKT